MTVTDERIVDPETLVGSLPADPVAMLPVRIETRFVYDATELRIRIFPDALHAHSHLEAISPEEHQAGLRYWNDRLTGSATIAWRTLLQRVQAPRAAWIVKTLTPLNVEKAEGGAVPEFPSPPIHEAPWTLPPKAVALPARWIVAGYREGQRIILRVGNTIPSELPLGPAPDPSVDDEPITQDVPSDDQSELPIDDGMRWLTDFDEAVAVGMALSVSASDIPGGFDGGIERLVVIGLPHVQKPAGDEQAKDTSTIAELLDAHRYTEGLSFLRQGTPTNNTAAVPSGFNSAEGPLSDSLDPAAVHPPTPLESGGNRLASALGIEPAALSETFDGDLSEDANGADMNALLWETTWGYFLDNYLDPIVDDAAAAMMRQHFVEHVRGRGPLPAVRIGDQPYGVLPAISGAHLRPQGDVERTLQEVLGRLTGLWGHASGRSPFLTRGQRPSDDLMDILESTPHSVSLRARSVVGPTVVANSQDLTRFAAHQEAMTNWLSEMVLDGQRVRGADFTARAEARTLRLPFVTADDLSESEGLASNYLFRLLVILRRGGAFAAIHADKEPTVLSLLARQAAQLEMAKAAARLVLDHQASTGGIPRRPTKSAPLEPEFVDLGPGERGSLLKFALTPYPPISGTQTMADFLASRSVEQMAANPLTAQLAEYVDALEAVSKLPTAEMHRLVAETLDLCSHRVDAWHTSLAAKRLADIRADDPNTLHVGAFGWLEDVRVETQPDSLGYVHAPSIGQATTAAILRSGHLAHKHEGEDLLALDLSSERVRDALTLLDGVRSGQSLPALLGYRFERGLRDRNIELAKYILDFRQMAPLVSSAGVNSAEPLESMAARDVVDGLKLLRMSEAGTITVAIDPPHQGQVIGVINGLARLLDAVSDVLVAEGVHQTAHGNLERGAAALDALDRQGPPPDPEFVRTPRSGFGVAHRLLVSLTDQPVAAGWPSAPDARAAAEPRLNSWVSRVLGDPSRYRFAANVVDLAATDPDLAIVQTVESSLDQIGISPLSVIWAAAEGGADQVTELDERIAHDLMARVTVDASDDGDDGAGDGDQLELELRILDGNNAVSGWPDGTLGLAALHTITEQIRSFISTARPSGPVDLLDPNSDDSNPEEPDPGASDESEHDTRAVTAVGALSAVSAALDQLAENPDPDPEDIRSALTAAAEFGVGGVLPGSEDQRGTNLADARRVLARRLSDASGAETATEKLAAVFGNGFVSLTLFTPPDPGELAACIADRPALVNEDPLALTTWMHQTALVRPGTANLAAVLTTAEMIESGTGPTELDVAQLPHEPGERWFGLPLDGTRLPTANIGLVIHAPGGFQPAAAQAGFVADEWHEVIPNPVETTGVSMHYDAPGTRAPQTILLGIPPDHDAETWTLDQLLDTVGETLDLAKTRAVDPKRIWMMNRALPAIYLAANARFEAPTVNVFEAEALYRASVEARP